MERAPFQILVFPFFKSKGDRIEYAIFKRVDRDYYQAIAGGGIADETPLEAAKRETREESGISPESEFTQLDSRNTIPVVGVTGEFSWGEEVYVVPEYCYGVEVREKELKLSREHIEYKWVGYEDARKMLKWDSNKNALWELNQRLMKAKDIQPN